MIDVQARENIARAFLKTLGEWYGAEGRELTAWRVDNANDDFDANMAMDAAFKSQGLNALGDDGMSDNMIDLWNAAWARAVEIQKGKDEGYDKSRCNPV